jgi:hypothetical protein
MGVSRVLKTVAETVRSTLLARTSISLTVFAFTEEGRQNPRHQQAHSEEGGFHCQGLAGRRYPLQHLDRHLWSHGS